MAGAVTMEIRPTGEWIEIEREGREPIRFERQELVLRREGRITKRWRIQMPEGR